MNNSLRGNFVESSMIYKSLNNPLAFLNSNQAQACVALSSKPFFHLPSWMYAHTEKFPMAVINSSTQAPLSSAENNKINIYWLGVVKSETCNQNHHH